MKKKAVFLVVCCFALFFGVMNVYSQSNFTAIQEGVENFSTDMAKSLPFNASLGLNWADAYIGKLFPGIPPHFGIGGAIGVTTMKMASMKEIVGVLGFENMPGMDNLYLPAYTAEVRIGGLFLPFDIGVKFGTLPIINLPIVNVGFDYTMYGADIRYALIEQGLIKPNLSLGFGYYHLEGGISVKAPISNLNIAAGNSGQYITINEPGIGLLWKTTVMELKAQLSKSFFIVTPYLGVGANYSWSEAGYEVKSELGFRGGASPETINAYLKSQGVNGVTIDENGFSSMVSKAGIGARAFGGLSLNLAILKIDITGMYNLLDQNWGGSLGLRVQL